MSVVRGYGLNGKSIYMNVAKPMSTWVTFTVAAADTGGLGVTSVKSNGYVNYLFMHTSQTPGAVNGVTNPNPPSGYAVISLTNTFNTFLGLRSHLAYPATSTSTTSTTANAVYSITALGTATTAQWQAKGLPQGLTPTVGQTFVATASGTIGGSATVGIPGAATITSVSIVGDPTTQLANSQISANGGAQLLLLFSGATSSSVTTLIPAAPAEGTIVRLELVYDGSSVSIGTGGL